MKKEKYVAPSVEIISIPRLGMLDPKSYMIDGKVQDTDTEFGFGGNGKSTDDPDANDYTWEDLPDWD